MKMFFCEPKVVAFRPSSIAWPKYLDDEVLIPREILNGVLLLFSDSVWYFMWNICITVVTQTQERRIDLTELCASPGCFKALFVAS